MKKLTGLVTILLMSASLSINAGNKNQLPLSYLKVDGLHSTDSGAIFAADGFDGSKVYYINSEGVTFDFGLGLNGPVDITDDKDGNLYVTNFNNKMVSKISVSGEVSDFAEVLDGPSGITSDSEGNLYVSHYGPNADGDTVLKITPEGVTSVFSQGGALNASVGITIDDHGNVYTANLNDGTVLKINPNGEQEVLAQIESDVGFAIGHLTFVKGNLYATGIASHKVYVIKPNGKVKVRKKTAQDYFPNGLTYDKSTGQLLIGDAFYKNSSLLKIKLKKGRK